MAFRFGLETVLRLRRSLEDEERLRLQTLLARRAGLESEARATREVRAALNAALKATMQESSLLGGELQFAAQRMLACEIRAAYLAESAATLGTQIERQQSALLQRRVERKTLEQLRDRQRIHYEVEVERHWQAQIEELFLLRRARSGERQAPSN